MFVLRAPKARPTPSSQCVRYEYFQTKVEILRVMVGKKQEKETLINEEAMLLGTQRSIQKPSLPMFTLNIEEQIRRKNHNQPNCPANHHVNVP
jgi:hypothetical protein